jgi:hypothetical protein
MASWSFLTNHARTMLCIAHDRGVRFRDIAVEVDITERRAHGIVADAPAGVLSHVTGSERAALVDESLVVSVPEAAVLLGVSEGLIYQLLDKGPPAGTASLVSSSPDPSPRSRGRHRANDGRLQPEDVLRATLS